MGAIFVARWKRLRERAPGSSSRNPLGFNSDAQQLAVRLQWVNFVFFVTSILRLVRCAIACVPRLAPARLRLLNLIRNSQAFNVALVIYPGSCKSVMQQLQSYPSLYQVSTSSRLPLPSPPSLTPFAQGAIDLVLEALPITIAIVISSTICSEVPSAASVISARALTHAVCLLGMLRPRRPRPARRGALRLAAHPPLDCCITTCIWLFNTCLQVRKNDRALRKTLQMKFLQWTHGGAASNAGQ